MEKNIELYIDRWVAIILKKHAPKDGNTANNTPAPTPTVNNTAVNNNANNTANNNTATDEAADNNTPTDVEQKSPRKEPVAHPPKKKMSGIQRDVVKHAEKWIKNRWFNTKRAALVGALQLATGGPPVVDIEAERKKEEAKRGNGDDMSYRSRLSGMKRMQREVMEMMYMHMSKEDAKRCNARRDVIVLTSMIKHRLCVSSG
jgi:hypothetical protein